MKSFLKGTVFFPTLKALAWDLTKLRARLQTKKMSKAYLKMNNTFPKKLHFGCGAKRVDGWLNVDIVNSDINVDFSRGVFPLPTGHFESIVSQHVIEHLDLTRELIPVLREFYRITEERGVIYLSCPCIKKICEAYISDGAESLVKARQSRYPKYSLNGYPSVQMINELFHQDGEHKNLFDFNLLSYTLKKSGFANVEEVREKDLLDRFPEFPRRNDDEQTLYVRASKV